MRNRYHEDERHLHMLHSNQGEVLPWPANVLAELVTDPADH